MHNRPDAVLLAYGVLADLPRKRSRAAIVGWTSMPSLSCFPSSSGHSIFYRAGSGHLNGMNFLVCLAYLPSYEIEGIPNNEELYSPRSMALFVIPVNRIAVVVATFIVDLPVL